MEPVTLASVLVATGYLTYREVCCYIRRQRRKQPETCELDRTIGMLDDQPNRLKTLATELVDPKKSLISLLKQKF